MKKDEDFFAAAAKLAEVAGTENLRTVHEIKRALANAYGDGVKDERKRQAKNRVRNAMGDVRSPYQPGKLPVR